MYSPQQERLRFNGIIDWMKADIGNDLVSIPRHLLVVPVQIGLKKRVEGLEKAIEETEGMIGHLHARTEMDWLEREGQRQRLFEEVRDASLLIGLLRGTSEEGGLVETDESAKETGQVLLRAMGGEQVVAMVNHEKRKEAILRRNAVGAEVERLRREERRLSEVLKGLVERKSVGREEDLQAMVEEGWRSIEERRLGEAEKLLL